MTAPHIFNATKINSQLLTGTMFILLSMGAECTMKKVSLTFNLSDYLYGTLTLFSFCFCFEGKHCIINQFSQIYLDLLVVEIQIPKLIYDTNFSLKTLYHNRKSQFSIQVTAIIIFHTNFFWHKSVMGGPNFCFKSVINFSVIQL